MAFFIYRNWRGEVRKVHIDTTRPVRMWVGSTEHHPRPQWLMTAFDLDRQEERTYALDDVMSWNVEDSDAS